MRGEKFRRHNNHHYKIYGHSPYESIFIMRSKFLSKNRCIGSSATFVCKIHILIHSIRSVLQGLYEINLLGSFTIFLHKIHVTEFSNRSYFGSPYKSKISESMPADSLQNICIRSMLQDLCNIMITGPLQNPYLRTLCKIYVFTASKRSMPPDPYLQFHICESFIKFRSPDLYFSILICGSSARPIFQDIL